MKDYTQDMNRLYDKFTVTRKDGSSVEGPTFTLRPQDPHARVAMMAYAQSVEKGNKALAADLRKLVRQHDEFGSAEGRWQSQMELEAVGEAHDGAFVERMRGVVDRVEWLFLCAIDRELKRWSRSRKGRGRGA